MPSNLQFEQRLGWPRDIAMWGSVPLAKNQCRVGDGHTVEETQEIYAKWAGRQWFRTTLVVWRRFGLAQAKINMGRKRFFLQMQRYGLYNTELQDIARAECLKMWRNVLMEMKQEKLS